MQSVAYQYIILPLKFVSFNVAIFLPHGWLIIIPILPMTGGSNKLTYTKCINSLEELLNAKVHTTNVLHKSAALKMILTVCFVNLHSHGVQVCSVDNVELESVIASPKIEVYFYGPVGHSNLTTTYIKELDGYKSQVIFLIIQDLSLVQLT